MPGAITHYGTGASLCAESIVLAHNHCLRSLVCFVVGVLPEIGRQRNKEYPKRRVSTRCKEEFFLFLSFAQKELGCLSDDLHVLWKTVLRHKNTNGMVE